MKSMAVLAATVGVLAALTLSGCTSSGSTTTGGSSSAAVNPLMPKVPSTLTATTAGTETKRIADQIQALVTKSDIVYSDDHAQVVAATDTAAAYYGVLRSITLEPTVSSVAEAKAIVSTLKSAGYTEQQTSDTNGVYLTALSSSGVPSKSWFVLIGGDDSSTEQSVLTLQIGSPDIP
jgi:hypothetical protein